VRCSYHITIVIIDVVSLCPFRLPIQKKLLYDLIKQIQPTSLPRNFIRQKTILVNIRNTATKAIKTLNFLKHNLSSCSHEVKASSYMTVVHPKMKYAAAVSDSYYQSDIQHLEKVQCRAARWVFNGFRKYSSVTDMLQQLSWPTLQVHCKTFRLLTLF